MDADEVRQVPDDEVDGLEGWERLTPEPDIRGVDAIRIGDGRWRWQVSVWVAAFLREQPLEGRLRTEMDAALRGVPGVAEVVHEDREVWVVDGEPSGRALVERAGAVVDDLAEDAREFMAVLQAQSPDHSSLDDEGPSARGPILPPGSRPIRSD